MSALIYEKKGKIAYLTYNRPEVHNAYNPQLLGEAEKAWCDFRDDPNVWVAIVTGAGDKAFCAGADIKDVPDMEYLDWRRFDDNLEVGKPTIAAVNGLAIGGGLTLAASCDLRIASENARFGLLAQQIGAIADLAVSVIPRYMPQAIAMEMLLTGRLIDAKEAYRIGFVNKVVPLSDLMSEATKMAEKICEFAPLAIRGHVEIARKTFDIPLSEGKRLGHIVQSFLFMTEDYKEGVKAFKEKRKPHWKCR